MNNKERKFRKRLMERFYNQLYENSDISIAAYNIAIDVELLLLEIYNAYGEVQTMLQDGRDKSEILEEMRSFREDRWGHKR